MSDRKKLVWAIIGMAVTCYFVFELALRVFGLPAW